MLGVRVDCGCPLGITISKEGKADKRSAVQSAVALPLITKREHFGAKSGLSAIKTTHIQRGLFAPRALCPPYRHLWNKFSSVGNNLIYKALCAIIPFPPSGDTCVRLSLLLLASL